MFIIAVCIANKFNFNSTLKTNLIILPLVLAGMIFLFFANIQNFSPQRIFPILGHSKCSLPALPIQLLPWRRQFSPSRAFPFTTVPEK